MTADPFIYDALQLEAYYRDLVLLLMEDIVLPVVTEEQRADIFDAIYNFPYLQEWLIDAGVGWA